MSLTDDPLILIRVWKEVTNAFAPKPAPAAPPAPKWLEALRQEIVASPQFLGEPIAYWQRRSDRSSEHVSRSCRKYYGMTFRDLLNHARVNRAKYVLRTTDKKVITVAFECGFGNMAHFHRTFARLCGISPHRWRQAGNATVPVT